VEVRRGRLKRSSGERYVLVFLFCSLESGGSAYGM
jgi:hypothetical protein